MRSHNPVKQFLEIARNHPVLSGRAQEDNVDSSSDALAAFKVHRFGARLWAALLAEFIGLAIFQIYGGSANDEVAAFGNGLTLAIAIYATANVSGGHLNPAVTFATCLTGHLSWPRGGLYCAAQLLGAIFGALVAAGLLPSAAVGGGIGPGCFTHTKGIQISTGQLFWWEAIMTFTLVMVVYATAVTKPGHGNIAPLAIGFTLFASAFVGGPYTGAALNPARVLGPAMVFHCFWDTAMVYVFAQLLGSAVAAALILPLYGFGQFGSLFDMRIFGFLGLSVPSHLRAQRLAGEAGPHAEVFMEEAPLRSIPAARPSALLASAPAMPQIPPPAFVPDYRLPPLPSAGRPTNPKPTLAALSETDRARPYAAGPRAMGAREAQHWQPGSG
ncbi:hypothetical protein WJX81_004683 [Elliptochloris bilobata]|uniref:Aquaporin n=1 Tax=Elliptochloris bilobata TaxID=381761 RepID=A0AAW1RCL6_9CHLO